MFPSFSRRTISSPRRKISTSLLSVEIASAAVPTDYFPNEKRVLCPYIAFRKCIYIEYDIEYTQVLFSPIHAWLRQAAATH